ncbi:MAG: DegV family protein [Lachnospiraceae bacterium]|nr:DegV family protein [Lachnospiraceae bacterium]
MSYRIVADSCCELPEELYNDPRFVRVPLELEIGNYRIKDDDNFDQADFISRIASSDECPRTSCPAPEAYMEAYSCDAEDIYVVSLGSKLSGCFNSATLASQLYEEELEDEFGPKNFHIIDAKSAAAGETQIALKLLEMAESDMTFDEICPAIDAFRDSVKTYFVVDNLDTFIKNGRIKGLKAAVATTLSIKPILTGVDGVIEQMGQAVGIKKALRQMVEIIHTRHLNNEKRQIIITHVNCPERAAQMAEALSDITEAPVIVLPGRGVTTTYANDGGIVVTI